MVRRKQLKPAAPAARESADEASAEPRIIGGKFRGRKLLYLPDRRTRPMKDRVREAVFNLIGPGIKGKHAIDLFAGTGDWGWKRSAAERSAGRSSSGTFPRRS